MRQCFGLILLLVGAAFGEVIITVPPIKDEVQEGDTALFSTPTRLDTSFRFGETNITNIRDIELFPDGTIAYGGVGRFATIGTATADGTVINPNSGGMQLSVAESVAVDEIDRAVYGGGVSSSPVALSVARVANWDDYGWIFRENLGGSVTKVLRLPDRDLLVGGAVSVRGDTNFYGLVRLDLSGALDTNFVYTNFVGMHVSEAAVTADGRILAAYQVTNNSIGMQGFGRWLPNGERDAAYDNSWAINGGTNTHVTVLAKAPGTNGFVAAVESWLAGPESPKGTVLFQLDEEGRPAGWLLPAPFVQGVVHDVAFEAINSGMVASNGYDRVIVAGDFAHILDRPYNRLASISRDGTVAWGFDGDKGPGGAIHAVEVQPDGKILIAGAFTNVGPVEAKGMARLEGNSGSGQTYLYWADEEFRGFEKLGQGVATLVRAGNTNTALGVDLLFSAPQGETNSPEMTYRVEFAPGQTVVDVPLRIPNETVRSNRQTFGMHVHVDRTNSNLLVTRPIAAFVVLDDELAGTLDPMFNLKARLGQFVLAVQPDGKMVVGGSGIVLAQHNLARYNVDGSLDMTFATNGIPTQTGRTEISKIEPQADGKIYVSGKFGVSATDAFGINYVARLNSDGTLDRSFDPRLSRMSFATADQVLLDVLDDGDVVVWLGGTVRREGAMLLEGLYRLRPNGQVRTAYFGVSAWRDLSVLEHLPTGEIFTYNRGRVAKYNVNGTVNTNFAVNVPSSAGHVYDMEVVGEWLWLGGSFRNVNSAPAAFLARVNVNSGLLDTNFNVTLDSEVQKIHEANGKIYITGSFTAVNGRERIRVARLNLDGSLDETFDAGYGPNRPPGLLEVQPDGKVIIGSDFDRVDGISVKTFARLEGDPVPGEIHFLSRRISADPTKGVATVTLMREGGSKGTVTANLETSEGSALAGRNFAGTNLAVTFGEGEFAKTIEIPVFGSEPFDRTFIVRLTSGGRVEEGTVLIDYTPGGVFAGTAEVSGATSNVNDIAIAPNGSIYLAGYFASINGAGVTNLARLNADMTVDTSFKLVPLPERAAGVANDWGPLSSVAVRTNGPVVFGGTFIKVGEEEWAWLAQANPDGSYDADFNDEVVSNRSVLRAPMELIVLPDNQLLVNDRVFLRRFHADGRRDTNFTTVASIAKTVVHPDGTLYGVRTNIPSSAVRVRPGDESLQTLALVQHRTTSGATQSARIETIAIAPDGNLLIGGDFTHVNSILAPRLAKISTNGIVNTNFNPQVGVTGSGFGARDSVTAIEVLWYGDILIGGRFEEVQGRPRRTLALLSPAGILRNDFDPIVEGSLVAEFEETLNGVVGRGGITAIDGNPVGQVFRLAVPNPPIAPVVEILWPTNGTEIIVSDAVVPLEVQVKTFDVDGFLENVVVEFDGAVVATNDSGGTFFLNQPNDGDHMLTVTATDEDGLRSSASVRFHVTMRPFPGLVRVTLSGSEVVITYESGRLEASSDLKVWRAVHTGGGEFRSSAGSPHEFFRLAF